MSRYANEARTHRAVAKLAWIVVLAIVAAIAIAISGVAP